jgi:predicted nucleic acid-binding protein
MARQKSPPDKPADRYFLDTGFVLARFNRRDQYHEKARQLAGLIASCGELWTTEAVLFEIAAAFSQPNHRSIALVIWDEFHGGNQSCRVREAAGPRLHQAVELFRERDDKAWSLTDCLSFVVMKEERLVDAQTTDRHFIQAGFHALLIES